MDTSTPLYGFLQCLGVIPIFVIVYVAWAWLTSGGNGANVPPEQGDGILRAKYVGQPMAVPAAEIVNQRMNGRNLGDDIDVYLADYTGTPAATSGMHHHQRSLDWMRENGRAESVGVHLHIVSETEMDRISANGTYDGLRPSWHNTAETEAPGITETHSGGMSDGAKLAAGCFMVAITGGLSIVAIIMLMMR